MALYDNLSQQYSGFTDPFGFREEEDAVGNARPVTQTIKTNPVTGEQTMTIKGSPYDLSAANPLTPTVAQPVQPTGGGAFLGGYEDMAPRPQMAPQMAAPQMPAVDNRNIVPLEQPAAGGYDPEQMAQVLQQAGLNYQQPRPIATLAQAGMSDANPPAISQQPQPSQAGGFLGATEDMAPAIPQQPEPTGGGGFLGEYADMAPAPSTPVAPAEAFPRPQTATQPAVSEAAVAPGSDEYTQRMLAELRKREGNYDSPPHAASSAQGAYGITAPAYSDIQRADPYFANRPQGQLSPADQDRAALVLRGLNQERLRSQGVEPTEANQQLAHFLGPKGAADYLKNGYISPEAAAANGGVEKVRQIAEERLALGRQLSGQAVAGVGREMGMGEPGYGGGGTMPAQSAITAASTVINDAFEKNDVDTLYKMAGSDNPQISGPARDKLEMMRNKQRGQKDADQLIGDGKTTDLSRHLTSRNKDGSWIKYYLLKRLGMDEMAKEEAQLLGSGTKMTALTSTDGKQYSADVDGNGAIVKAWDESGKAVTNATTLANLQSSSLQKGERGQATGTRVRDAAGTEWSQVPTTRGMVFYNNKGERGVPSGKTVPIGIGSDIQLQGQLQTQKKQIDLAWDPMIAAAKAGAEGLVKYNIQYGTSLYSPGVNQQTGQPIIVDRNTGQVVTNTNGSATATQSGAGGAPGTAGPNAQAQERAGANLTAMNKDIQDNLVPDARKADSQVNSINEIFSILKDPGAERVFGIYNDVMAGQDARGKKLFNDFIAGKIVAGSPEYEDFRRRYSELGLDESQIGVLRRLDALSAAGVGAAVRELTGTTGISNQDVKVAQRNNVSAGDWPMLAAYSQWNYQRFESDLKRAKAEWAADNIERFPNSAALDKAWRTESSQLRKDNDAISEARAQFLKGHNNLPATQKAAKIKQAYELYPMPRYQAGQWENRKTKSLSAFEK